MSASSSSSIQPYHAPKNAAVNLEPKVIQSLAAARGTKTNTLAILKSLSSHGLLKDLIIGEENERDLKRKLTDAAALHSKAHTPYGPLVQFMELGLPGCRYLEYIDPCAFLYHVSCMSADFAFIMQKACAPGQPLRIVIYADGLEPGNPFRHDQARHLVSIYWVIADWPQWLLQRSFAWPIFAIIRSKFLSIMEGGLGRLMRMILRIFFMSRDHSFTSGVHINCPAGGYVVTAVLAGILADLEGHREVTSWKGTGGRLMCLTCSNVTNMLHSAPAGNEVPASCSDTKKFICRSNGDVFDIIDELEREFERLGKKKTTSFLSLETKRGFTFTPGGLLLDKELRDSIYKPVDHCIRDWQHTICQDGVANTHIHNLNAHCLVPICQLDIGHIQTFSQNCKYPTNWGRLDKSALAPARLTRNTFVSFSSTILTVVTVIMMFLEKFSLEELVPEHVDAFNQLYHIVGILRMGPEDAMKHTKTLRTLMRKYLDTCVRLYGQYTKPKGHHMFHIVDGMLWIGRLLSCFVTERKHRIVKQCSVHVYRHFEHTVLTDVVNQSMEQILEGHDLYKEEFLIAPKTVTLSAVPFRVATRCVTRVGLIANGDLVIDKTGDVGMVVRVFQRVSDSLIFLEVDAYPCVGGNISCRATDRAYKDFFVSTTIVEQLIWYFDSPGIVRFSIPAPLLYQE